MVTDKTLIEVENLSVEYRHSGRRVLKAVSNVSFGIYENETLGIVGESGCGKSSLGKAVIRLLKPASGEVRFRGRNVTGLNERDFSEYRKRMQMIFQDPYASLDPRMKVRDLIAEPLETYHVCENKEETTKRVVELMNAVGLSSDYLNRYAHQFSGGQRQRIGIARAIALRPDFIVCDEPVSALDVSVQNQILNLLKDLQKQYGLTFMFISHDLSVVRFISDRVCVMFMGKICEMGDISLIYREPLHPYTRFLLEAIPKIDPSERNRERRLLSGEMPSQTDPPKGCRFHSRCPYATEKCVTDEPPLTEYNGRKLACHLYNK